MRKTKSTLMIEPIRPGFAHTAHRPHIPLQSLINQLLRHSLNDMMRKSDSSVMNEVSSDLYIMADESRITPVIEELLATVITNARKGRIHIRADRFRDIVILEIEDRSNYNGYALDYSIRSLEPLARTVGGYISIKGQQKLDTTISFSFPNQISVTGYDC
ncbi:MAG: sensor histidine kinase [Chitinophagaceae bacterium]|nr:sensor histidine kinase [Chitinophagaceae bacterium]